MGKFIGDLAMMLGGQAMGAGIGALTAKANDKRQLAMQRALMDMQMQGSREMTDYGYQKQYEMWEKTGPKGQMEQLRKAGLNPSLIYGMGGAGGQTIGGGGMSVSGGNAPSGGGEIMGGMGMGLQMAMMKAQIDVMRTQAEKNEAEADSTRGKEGTIGAAQIKDITQGIENKKAQKLLTDFQAYGQQLQNKITSESLEDTIDQIKYNTIKTLKEVEILTDQQIITRSTKDEMIRRVGLENTEIASRAVLNDALKNKASSEIKLNEEQINKIVAEIKNMTIKQGIDVLNVETDRLRIAKEFGGDDDGLTKFLDATLKTLGIVLGARSVAGGLMTPKPSPIGFRK